MEFSSLESLLKVFSNEYIAPNDKVLLVFVPMEFKKKLDFLHSESFFVSHEPGQDLQVDYNFLPFEEQYFDIIINFTNIDVSSYLKPGKTMLVYGNIINNGVCYKLGNDYFSVV